MVDTSCLLHKVVVAIPAEPYLEWLLLACYLRVGTTMGADNKYQVFAAKLYIDIHSFTSLFGFGF